MNCVSWMLLTSNVSPVVVVSQLVSADVDTSLNVCLRWFCCSNVCLQWLWCRYLNSTRLQWLWRRYYKLSSSIRPCVCGLRGLGNCCWCQCCSNVSNCVEISWTCVVGVLSPIRRLFDGLTGIFLTVSSVWLQRTCKYNFQHPSVSRLYGELCGAPLVQVMYRVVGHS